jgi:hypothetical protein
LAGEEHPWKALNGLQPLVFQPFRHATSAQSLSSGQFQDDPPASVPASMLPKNGPMSRANSITFSGKGAGKIAWHDLPVVLLDNLRVPLDTPLQVHQHVGHLLPAEIRHSQDAL